MLRYRLFMGNNHTSQALPCLNTKHTAAKSITKGQHALVWNHFSGISNKESYPAGLERSWQYVLFGLCYSDLELHPKS
jgi:hypothetical protein